MGEMKGITKARMELEDLYSGIPDDSVNLTFQDLAVIQEKKKSTAMDPIQESKINKLPSLDFKRGLQESNDHDHHHAFDGKSMHGDGVHGHGHQHHAFDAKGMHGVHGHGYGHDDRNMRYDDDDDDDRSMMSMYQERGGRSRRSGIPHSNICTICSTYIYLFKRRCLVCGRVYCRSCVDIGMGDMTEGRKCIQCLGRRFSQRYIERAGTVGCCLGYAGNVKLAELKWADKGPRRSGERTYGQSTMTPRSNQRSTTRPHHVNSNPPSFVSTSSYSPYSPHHHHLPL